MSKTFDFVVVGGGTAGCLLANKLAEAPNNPSVVILEAGSGVPHEVLRTPFDRFAHAFTQPEVNYGYSLTPQKELHDRVLPYQRGKGLGGSSIINFMVYLYGASADFDRWSEIVGDESWQWKNVQDRFKEIEHFHADVPQELREFCQPREEDHGKHGALDVSLPSGKEIDLVHVLKAAADYGYPMNPDFNSGNPVGFGIPPSSSDGQARTTSASAHLSDCSPNLTILGDSTAVKVLFDGKKALGVELANGRQVFANNEVILTAGAIDSPKLLLLSGVGDAKDLADKGIDCVHDLPSVGKNLQDHCAVPMVLRTTEEFSSRHAFASDPEKVRLARKQWARNKTGPMSHGYSGLPAGFIQSKASLASKEFKELDSNLQEYLRQPTVPSYEFIFGSPLPPGLSIEENESCWAGFVVGMTPQSRGEVMLRSADPADAPLINMELAHEPYDKRVIIDGMRETMEFFKSAEMAKHVKGFMVGPEGDSDEQILSYIRDQAIPLWHANGSVKMGRVTDQQAAVDTSFRVRGLQNLRVADLSVCPFTPNNHTQSTAYLIGHLAAEKILSENA